MLTEIMAQTPTFQKAVYRGELVDNDDVLDFIMNRPNVMPRLVDIRHVDVCIIECCYFKCALFFITD